MKGVSIRRAMLADAEQIADVYVRTSSVAERGYVPDSELDAMTPGDYLESWLRRTESSEPHATWVAEIEGDIVGFCYVEPSPDDDATAEIGHVDMLFVLPEHAGQGIGARLLAEGVAHLRTRGFSEATLWALARNQRTRRFYEREGWIAAADLKRYDHEGYSIELIRYARSLSADDEPCN
jgi:GNAT superfamily N-acetyltransferase